VRREPHRAQADPAAAADAAPVMSVLRVIISITSFSDRPIFVGEWTDAKGHNAIQLGCDLMVVKLPDENPATDDHRRGLPDIALQPFLEVGLDGSVQLRVRKGADCTADVKRPRLKEAAEKRIEPLPIDSGQGVRDLPAEFQGGRTSQAL
jgi:hypothetical protein